MMLDGVRLGDAMVIAAMRNLGGDSTIEALMLETDWSYRQCRRALSDLERQGRVIRMETGEENHFLQPHYLLADEQRAPLPRPRKPQAMVLHAVRKMESVVPQRRYRAHRQKRQAMPQLELSAILAG